MIWAEALFNCIGPMNDRTVQSFPVLNEMMEYATNEAVRGKLKPGSWAEGIIDAVDRGEVPQATCPALMVDYMGPSLDTTISAISNAVWLFAQHPDQWDLIREDPSLIRGTINEVLRYESPIQAFSRSVARDVDMDGVLLPAGSRAIVFMGRVTGTSASSPTPTASTSAVARMTNSASGPVHTPASACISPGLRCGRSSPRWPAEFSASRSSKRNVHYTTSCAGSATCGSRSAEPAIYLVGEYGLAPPNSIGVRHRCPVRSGAGTAWLRASLSAGSSRRGGHERCCG
jgi:hypothetical protein